MLRPRYGPGLFQIRTYKTGASPLHHRVNESNIAHFSFFKGNVITSLIEKCLVIEGQLHVTEE